MYELVNDYAKQVYDAQEPSKAEMAEKARVACKTAYTHLLKQRPYIPPKFFAKTKAILDELVTAANNITRAMRREQMPLGEGEAAEKAYQKIEELWAKAEETIDKKVSALLTELVADIQARLGVKDTPNASDTKR